MVFAAYSTTSAASGPASSPSFSACFFAGSASLPPPSPPLLSSASAPAPLPPLQGPVPPGASLLGLPGGGTRGMQAPRTAAAAGGRGRGGGRGGGGGAIKGFPAARRACSSKAKSHGLWDSCPGTAWPMWAPSSLTNTCGRKWVLLCQHIRTSRRGTQGCTGPAAESELGPWGCWMLEWTEPGSPNKPPPQATDRTCHFTVPGGQDLGSFVIP